MVRPSKRQEHLRHSLAYSASTSRISGDDGDSEYVADSPDPSNSDSLASSTHSAEDEYNEDDVLSESLRHNTPEPVQFQGYDPTPPYVDEDGWCHYVNDADALYDGSYHHYSNDIEAVYNSEVQSSDSVLHYYNSDGYLFDGEVLDVYLDDIVACRDLPSAHWGFDSGEESYERDQFNALPKLSDFNQELRGLFLVFATVGMHLDLNDAIMDA
jgi:hypothetical protein